jgi:thioredoxin reductase (NADPH)
MSDLKTIDTYSLVIIGSGPAGFTAAIYAARADLKPIVFEGIEPGGQLMTTTDVENYPGFPSGVMGPEMMNMFREQAVRFGAETRYGLVTKIDAIQRPFKLTIDESYEIYAEAIIVATGASAKWLNLPSETRLRGHGVSACATCDGAFFRNQHIVVVGGGDTAMEEASFLTKFASKVTLVHRRNEFRASKAMQHRVLNNPKIEVQWNSVVKEILGDKVVQGVVLENILEHTETALPDVTGVFVAIGHQPNTDLFKGILDMDETGYILTKGKTTHTNVEGIFACGDAQDSSYRQAITAAGTGCMAALDAERWLSEG